MVTEDTPQRVAPGSVVVYLCNGQTVVVPAVAKLLMGDEYLVCRDCNGVEIRRFRNGDVYMCTRSRVPVCPLD